MVNKLAKCFNTNGICSPKEHYMVNIEARLAEIETLVDDKKYFVMNRARQYGKTTTLNLLVKYLSDKYTVFFISFEGLGESAFKSEESFCNTICELLYDTVHYGEVPKLEEKVKNTILEAADGDGIEDIRGLSGLISEICNNAGKKVVLMIDEVDQASNYKGFLDFLGMLRSKFLKRATRPTFQSVILAGVYDIKNLKLRIRGNGEHQYNSPWNIAADFRVDMSFTIEDIIGMLTEYAEDRLCSMEVEDIAEEIYEYTAGYPYLVSKICKLIDERKGEEADNNSWSRQDISKAVKTLLKEPDTLFDDMRKKITDYPELKKMLYAILFRGENYPYNPDNFAIDIGTMFGFIKEQEGQAVVSNRIFETRLYNLFLSEEMTGNYYVEAQTRDQTRTDIVIDYLGKQYVIEFKIWRGEEYNKRGERQLAEYLEYYHLERGYLLSFNFNKNKKPGVKEIQVGNRTIFEVIV